MTEQPIDTEQSEEPPGKRVRVPWRRGASIFEGQEYVDADLDAAGQWDATQWRDQPLC